jgi:hypothetical protein
VNPGRLGALLPVAGAYWLGAALARTLLLQAPRRIAVDLAQPMVVVTSWGAYGGEAFAILAATVALATLSLIVAARRLARDAVPGDVAAIALVAALGVAGAYAWPFVFSSDAYAYAAYGAMANDGLDPYAPLPASAHSALYDATRWQWGGAYPACVYGPAFVGIAAALGRATSAHGVTATLWAFRLLAGLAFVAGIPLLGAALAAWSAARRFTALCAYALNPVSLWSVAEGHNDALLMLLVMTAGAVAVRRPPLGAFLIGLSPLLKAPGAALALGAALESWLGRRPERSSIVACVLAGLALAAAVTLPPLGPVLAAAGAHGRYAPEISIQGLLGPLPALGLAALAAAYGSARLAARDRGGLAWIGIALLMALPNAYPWYALWLVPWCLGAGDTGASRALWAATIFSVSRYLPDAWGTLSPDGARLAAGAAALPLLWAATDLRRTAFDRKKATQP